jgi:pyrroline-5-carboxylate reductase
MGRTGYSGANAAIPARSVAASVPTSSIESGLGGKVPVVRAMPNTPCLVGQGMTALCKGNHAGAEHLEIACELFNVVGRTVVVDEKHMDAVTGLSASGPAYIYIILESLAEAGVKVGLPRDVATLLAAQTALGAAAVVLETGDHPALLKDAVTTPAGCTIDGIMELEEGKLRVTLIKAVVKAAQRAGSWRIPSRQSSGSSLARSLAVGSIPRSELQWNPT